MSTAALQEVGEKTSHYSEVIKSPNPKTAPQQSTSPPCGLRYGAFFYPKGAGPELFGVLQPSIP